MVGLEEVSSGLPRWRKGQEKGETPPPGTILLDFLRDTTQESMTPQINGGL